MGYGTPDVYYQPEQFGLTKVGEIDDWDACYSFDILAVWQHEDGRLFFGQDAGCSCPSPFEDVTSLDHLTELTEWGPFKDAVEDHCRRWEWSFDQEPEGDGWVRDDLGDTIKRKRWKRHQPEPAEYVADKVELLAKVHKLYADRPVDNR